MNGNLYELHASPLEALLKAPRIRRELLAHASGRVLEVGAGTGFNFPHYPQGVVVEAHEPDEGMRKKAQERAREFKNITVGSSEAESLAYADASFDAAVATLAFCSIDEPELALKEIHRVLKPGGRLLMMDHIRKHTPFAGKVLDLLTPVWKTMSDGCRLNREPALWIQMSPLKVEEHRRLWAGYGETWVLRKEA